MANTLVDELLQLQAANDALYVTNEAVSQFRNNPSWILGDIESNVRDIQDRSSEEGCDSSRKEVEKGDLYRFYFEGLASRTHEEDERCIETEKTKNRIDEEYAQCNAECVKVQEEFQQADDQVKLAKARILEDERTIASLKSRIDDLNRELIRDRKNEQERFEKEKDEVLKRTSEEAEAEITKYKGYLKTDRVSIIEIGKWLLLGILVGVIASEIVQALVTGISGNVNAGAFCGILSFLIGMFLPLGIYVKGVIEERKWDRQSLKKAKKEAQQKTENVKSGKYPEEMQKKREEELRRIANTEKEIAAFQDEIKRISADKSNEQKTLTKLEENRSRCESNLEAAQKSVESLRERVKNAEKEAEQAFEAFLFSLEDELFAAQEQERMQFNKTVARMDLCRLLRQRIFDSAFTLSSVGAVYNPNDLNILPRVIDKLQSNRASTLSEALNAVDADLLAERMHNEQMAATRKHNEQMAVHERERNRILEEQAKAELEIQEKRAAQEAEHQAAMAQAAQEQADAELERLAAEEERLAEEQAANIEMLRMQSEQTAAQQEAAAAEAQRLLEQQQAYQRAAENEELQRQERISDNLNHCRHCIHAPHPVNEYTYCEYGGWDCKDADRCAKYRSA